MGSIAAVLNPAVTIGILSVQWKCRFIPLMLLMHSRFIHAAGNGIRQPILF